MALSRGFTLVELLVVIVIILILLAVVLPALNQTHEIPGRRATCINNQMQLAKALAWYEATFAKYPGYTNQAKAENQLRRIPWTIAIFPYIDNNALYVDFAEATAPSPVPEIGLFICPTDPPSKRGLPTNNYIINAGRWDGKEQPGSGLAHDRFDAPKVFTNSDFVRSGEGSANTLALSENVIAANWDEGYWPGTGPDPGPGKERQSMVWHADFSNPTRRVNGNLRSVTVLDGDSARPSSFHQGGVVAAFLDTHVVFLREDIDHKVYVQLLTSCHSQTNAPDRLYKLSSADYQ